MVFDEVCYHGLEVTTSGVWEVHGGVTTVACVCVCVGGEGGEGGIKQSCMNKDTR